jgi:competence protein ComEA
MDRTATPWRTLEAPELRTADQTAGNASSRDDSAATRAIDRWRPAIVALGLVLSVAIGGFAYLMTGRPAGEPERPAAIAAPSGSVDPAAIVVDVTGAVVHPGVYHLPLGSRVADAIERAGGFGPRVDPAAAGRTLNLAAPVKDGDQVRVPSRDDAGAPTAGGGTGGSGSTSGGPKALVDLNTATEAELDALPGVGPVTAGKIVAGRPFHSIEELTQRKIVGASTFEKLRGLIAVR